MLPGWPPPTAEGSKPDGLDGGLLVHLVWLDYQFPPGKCLKLLDEEHGMKSILYIHALVELFSGF